MNADLSLTALLSSHDSDKATNTIKDTQEALRRKSEDAQGVLGQEGLGEGNGGDSGANHSVLRSRRAVLPEEAGQPAASTEAARSRRCRW